MNFQFLSDLKTNVMNGVHTAETALDKLWQHASAEIATLEGKLSSQSAAAAAPAAAAPVVPDPELVAALAKLDEDRAAFELEQRALAEAQAKLTADQAAVDALKNPVPAAPAAPAPAADPAQPGTPVPAAPAAPAPAADPAQPGTPVA